MQKNQRIQETDMKAVKETAKRLIEVEPIETKLSPIVISHPLFNTAFSSIRDDNGNLVVVNILKDKSAFNVLINTYKSLIDMSEEITSIGYILNKPYRLYFLYLIKDYVSADDMGTYIETIWTTVEQISVGKDFTKDQVLELLYMCNRSNIMNKSDKAVLKGLPEEVIIYRGVGSHVGEVKGLSWTLDIGIARFFANRFDNDGQVYKATIHKKDIFAYYGCRGEKEVVVDYTKLANIEQIEK